MLTKNDQAILHEALEASQVLAEKLRQLGSAENPLLGIMGHEEQANAQRIVGKLDLLNAVTSSEA